MRTAISLVVCWASLLFSSSLAAQENPTIRLLNLVESAEGLDLWIDAIEPAGIADVGPVAISRSRALAPGNHELAVGVSGTDRTDAGATFSASLQADSAYVVVAVGDIAANQPVVLRRAISDAPPPGTLFVRQINASSVDPVSIVLFDATGEPKVLEATSFGEISSFATVVAGRVDVAVVRQNGDTVYRAGDAFAAGAILTLVPVGSPDDESYALRFVAERNEAAQDPLPSLRVKSDADNGRIRVVNLYRQSNGSGIRVDIGSPSATSFDDVSFASATEVREIPFGDRTLDVFVDSGDRLVEATVNVIAGLYRAVYVLGDDAEGTAVILTADATSTPRPGESTVRFLNGRPDTIGIAVEIRFSDGASKLIPVSSLGAFTQYERRPGGPATVSLTGPTDDGPFHTVEGSIPTESAVTIVAAPGPAVYLVDDSEEGVIDPLPRFEGESSVSSESTAHGSVGLFPVPSTDYVVVTTIAAGMQDGVDFRLVDLNGRIVRTLTNVRTPQTRIDLDGLVSGTYHLVVSFDGVIHGTSTLVVSR